MQFIDRVHAGKLLAQKLKSYKNTNSVVYALPRGGVITGYEISKYLHIPLDIVLTRKISHPYDPEYAVAAVSESGCVASSLSSEELDEAWFAAEIKRQQDEIRRRRKVYLAPQISPEGKTAILVDDGAATGLTLEAGIMELKQKNVFKIIIAVPVLAASTEKKLLPRVDRVVAILVPLDKDFLGSVGSYYQNFLQVEDYEVIDILSK